jgi:hypothetical protein
VSKFLNLHLLNYNFEQTRSHCTRGQPGALHQFPQSNERFLRILMPTSKLNALNQCEIVGILTIILKRKEISSI